MDQYLNDLTSSNDLDNNDNDNIDNVNTVNDDDNKIIARTNNDTNSINHEDLTNNLQYALDDELPNNISNNEIIETSQALVKYNGNNSIDINTISILNSPSENDAYKVNDTEILKKYFMKSKLSRVRSRFVVPVILYKNKNICRSGTLSLEPEMLLNTLNSKTKEMIYGISR